MIGYKAFNKDLKCRDKQYSIGDTFTIDGKLTMCKNGIHFCQRLADVFKYYDRGSRVCEVEAIGETITDDNKTVTSKLRIIRELSSEEITRLMNTGYYNTGNYNIGNYNTGNYNTGNYNTDHYNTGNYNTGYRNTGYRNTGNYNTGNYNTGDSNTGNYNTGDSNTGNYNTGDYNTGDYNTGYRNTGNYNTGYRNTGDYNTGNYNTGDWNTGHRNTGDKNTGYYNTGNYNTGNYNTGDRNTGLFNTNTANVRMFNQNTDIEFNSEKYSNILSRVNKYIQSPNVWINSSSMTEQEKTDNPTYITTGGYLKKQSIRNNVELTDDDKQFFMSLPNFDADIFKQCTGIDINTDKIITIDGIKKTVSLNVYNKLKELLDD